MRASALIKHGRGGIRLQLRQRPVQAHAVFCRPGPGIPRQTLHRYRCNCCPPREGRKTQKRRKNGLRPPPPVATLETRRLLPGAPSAQVKRPGPLCSTDRGRLYIALQPPLPHRLRSARSPTVAGQPLPPPGPMAVGPRTPADDRDQAQLTSPGHRCSLQPRTNQATGPQQLTGASSSLVTSNSLLTRHFFHPLYTTPTKKPKTPLDPFSTFCCLVYAASGCKALLESNLSTEVARVRG